MKVNLSRREFIMLGGLGMGSLAFSQYFPNKDDLSYPDQSPITTGIN
jgi:hypothetical protein